MIFSSVSKRIRSQNYLWMHIKDFIFPASLLEAGAECWVHLDLHIVQFMWVLIH